MIMKSYELNKEWSNWLKLIAAILVAVSHYSTVIVINNHWSDNSFLRFWCQGGYIGVAIFFFFSGYGLMESEKKHHLKFKEFFLKRFLRVYLPILMVSVIWIPIYYFIIEKNIINITLGSFLYDLFWGFKDCVLWFVKILFIFYVIFYTFSWLRLKGKILLSHVIIIAGTIFAICVAVKYNYPNISIPLFTIGLYSSLFKEKSFLKLPYSILMLIIMSIFCLIIFITTRDTNFAHGTINCIIVCIALYCIYLMNTPPLIRLTNIWLSAIYMIYIIHFKVLDLMTSIYGFIPFWSWALVTIIITIIFTYLKRLLRI